MKLQENPSYIALREKLDNERSTNKDLLHTLAELNLEIVGKLDRMNGNVAEAHRMGTEAIRRLDKLETAERIASEVREKVEAFRAAQEEKQRAIKKEKRQESFDKSLSSLKTVIAISSGIGALIAGAIIGALKAFGVI